jgi:hypothetical protein
MEKREREKRPRGRGVASLIWYCGILLGSGLNGVNTYVVFLPWEEVEKRLEERLLLVCAK